MSTSTAFPGFVDGFRQTANHRRAPPVGRGVILQHEVLEQEIEITWDAPKIPRKDSAPCCRMKLSGSSGGGIVVPARPGREPSRPSKDRMLAFRPALSPSKHSTTSSTLPLQDARMFRRQRRALGCHHIANASAMAGDCIQLSLANDGVSRVRMARLALSRAKEHPALVNKWRLR